MEDKPQAPWELTPEALAKVQDAPPEPPEPSHEDEPREPLRDFRRTTPTELAIALGLSVVAVLSVVVTNDGVGHSWDEAYYYQPAQMTVEWLGEFFSNPGHAASREVIDRLWSGEIDPGTERPVGIIELPSICKWAMGVSWALFHNLWGDLRALRFPTALAFGASVFLIYLLTLNSYRRRAAVIAAVTFMVMPRVFGHAHIGATETITSMVLLLAIYCYFKGLNSPWWAIWFGVAYGIALATKINAVLLAPALIIWGHAFHRRTYVNNLFAMIFLSPVIWVAVWPWLWHDTLYRIFDYFNFFSRHQQTAVWYLSRTYGYGRENAPWHYPIVMTLVTVPVPVLFFAICGLARTAVHCRWEYRGILFTGYAALLLVHAALPGTPKYDGTRLFFSIFPMLAILAGGGADSLVQLVPWNRTIHRSINFRHVVAALFLFAVLGNGVWAIARYHPHELSYFNVFTGGLKGAQHRFEITYWGEACNDRVIAKLNELHEGARIQPLAMHGLVLENLQEWGQLRKDLVIVDRPPLDRWLLNNQIEAVGRALNQLEMVARDRSAVVDQQALEDLRQWQALSEKLQSEQAPEVDYWLLQNRRGFFGEFERKLVDYPALWTYDVRGVDFFYLYARKQLESSAQK